MWMTDAVIDYPFRGVKEVNERITLSGKSRSIVEATTRDCGVSCLL